MRTNPEQRHENNGHRDQKRPALPCILDSVTKTVAKSSGDQKDRKDFRKMADSVLVMTFVNLILIAGYLFSRPYMARKLSFVYYPVRLKS